MFMVRRERLALVALRMVSLGLFASSESILVSARSRGPPRFLTEPNTSKTIIYAPTSPLYSLFGKNFLIERRIWMQGSAGIAANRYEFSCRSLKLVR